MPEYIDKEKLIRDLIDNRSFYPAIVKKAIESALVIEIETDTNDGRKSEWTSVEDRLPTVEEYLTHHNDGLDTLKRITIAYMTDTIEYTIGHYDGYKWVNQLGNRVIKDVIAWKPFETYTLKMKGE